MAPPNLALVRSIYADWTRGDFRHFADADLYTKFFHPDAEIVLPAIFPDTEPSYSGLEGFQRYQQQLAEIWDNWRLEPERFFAADDRVLVFARTSGTGRQSGVALAIPTAHLFTLRDGRVTRLEVFLDRQAALEAAGVEE
jgi:ketosteroid isomerase-like protein